MKKKTILIIDGQGGRLGVLLTERIKTALTDFSITAVGTNSIATAAMLRAGADRRPCILWGLLESAFPRLLPEK